MAKVFGTPAAWKGGNVCYGSGLTLKTAKKMLQAAENEAGKQGVPMVFAIADSGGNLLAFHRMENAMLISVQVAMDKAYTAVYGKMHTGSWTNPLKDGTLMPLFIHERLISFPGGFPLIKKGKLVGGLGVSGGTTEDVPVAMAALKAGGFSVSEAEEALKEAEKRG